MDSKKKYFCFVLIIAFWLNQSSTHSMQVNQNQWKKHYYLLSLFASSNQLIQMRGFMAENHTVITPDGYVIQIQRVVNQRRHLNGTIHGYPIILFAGFSLSSEGFLANSDGLFLPNKDLYIEFENNFSQALTLTCPPATRPERAGRGLPYTLANCGYDVWMANVRDNIQYSTHLTLSHKDPLYWNVNLDSYTVDGQTIIDYVLAKTQAATVGAICHSIGCNDLLQLLAEKVKYNDLIKPFFNLAPYVYVHNILSPILIIPAIIEPILRNLPYSIPDLRKIQPYFSDLVQHDQVVRSIYLFFFKLIGGYNPVEFDYERFYRVPTHFPNTVAYHALAHIGQRWFKQAVYKYDYGLEKNLRVYGQPTPPMYDLKKVTNKYIVFFSGNHDTLADDIDLVTLKKALGAPLYAEFKNDMSHTDFALGRNVNISVNLPILKILHQLQLNYN